MRHEECLSELPISVAIALDFAVARGFVVDFSTRDLKPPFISGFLRPGESTKEVEKVLRSIGFKKKFSGEWVLEIYDEE